MLLRYYRVSIFRQDQGQLKMCETDMAVEGVKCLHTVVTNIKKNFVVKKK